MYAEKYEEIPAFNLSTHFDLQNLFCRDKIIYDYTKAQIKRTIYNSWWRKMECSMRQMIYLVLLYSLILFLSGTNQGLV